MEEWQIELISKNLTKLMELTDCNNGLLTRLETCQILGRDDTEKLNVTSLLPLQKSRDFYNIIKTRKNSFEPLLKALEETCQSGALAILSGESYFDDTQISYDKYSELGKGSYGTIVYKGKIGDRDVAVKMVHSDFAGGVQALHEVKVLRDCDAHENVVRYFGAKRNGTSILIALELCDMSLKEWVKNKYADVPHVEVLRQITTGLEWLHSRKIVHRDIKPENVLIARHLKRVKLSDFGLSRSILDGNSFVATASVGGTSGWMAPEILAHHEQESKTQCKFTYASDVFSLGCVYYYVLSDGKYSFGNPVTITCQYNILKGKSVIEAKEIQHGCSQNTLLIDLMILQDPKSRPSCTKILSYPLFWSQNDRVRFLEKLFTQIGGEMEKKSNYKMQDPCRFDHSAEIRVLRDLGCPAYQEIGCVLPFAYTQHTTEQVSKVLEGVEGANTLKKRSVQLDKPSDRKKLRKENSHKRIPINHYQPVKEKEHEMTNPEQVPGVVPSNISSSTIKSAAELNRDELKFDEISPTIINSEATFKSNLRSIQSDQTQMQIHTELNGLKQLNLEEKHARLFKIVKNEDLSIIKGVLESIATDTKITQVWHEEEKSLLHAAVARGDYDVVEYLLNNQGFQKVLSEPRFEHTLVHDCIKDIHKIDEDAFEQKCRILELLFMKTPQLIESRGTDKHTPLHVAAARKFVNGKQIVLIEILLRHNPNVNAKDKDGNTPLHWLFKYTGVPGNAFEIMRLLITHNANPDALDQSNLTFLHYAADNASPSLFHEVVVYLVSIHKTNSFTIISKNGWTVLHYAVRLMQGNPLSETLEIFKTHGVDFNALDRKGDSVMFIAIRGKRSEDFLNTLIRFGADWTITNEKQETVLHKAALQRNLSALKLFISLGTDVNAKDKHFKGNTPLHKALSGNSDIIHDVVAELVNNGADPTLMNGIMESPIDRAKKRLKEGKVEQRTVELLENASSTKTKF